MITEGVTPTLHVDYKRSRIKQYHKEGRALRTETTINDPRDFDVGKRLKNLPALREIGFSANRRLLDVETCDRGCIIGEAAFEQLQAPLVVGSQRVSALRFGERRTLAVLGALTLFYLHTVDFRNAALKLRLAQLHGLPVEAISTGSSRPPWRNSRRTRPRIGPSAMPWTTSTAWSPTMLGDLPHELDSFTQDLVAQAGLDSIGLLRPA